MAVALLDTNAVSDLMRDHPQVKLRVRAPGGALVTRVVVCGEIRYGLERLHRSDGLSAHPFGGMAFPLKGLQFFAVRSHEFPRL